MTHSLLSHTFIYLLVSILKIILTTDLVIMSFFKSSSCFFQVVPSSLANFLITHPPLVINSWLSSPTIRPEHSSTSNTKFFLLKRLFLVSPKALVSFRVMVLPKHNNQRKKFNFVKTQYHTIPSLSYKCTM